MEIRRDFFTERTQVFKGTPQNKNKIYKCFSTFVSILYKKFIKPYLLFIKFKKTIEFQEIVQIYKNIIKNTQNYKCFSDLLALLFFCSISF